jgi:DNA-binding transcriptional LysR family regulator
MQKLSLRHLTLINSLIENGSRKKVAESLGITESTISYTLKQIHNLYPHALFRKDRGKLIPMECALQFQKQYNDLHVYESEKKEVLFSCDSIIEHFLIHYIHNVHKNTKICFTPTAQSEDKRIMNLRNKMVDIDIGSPLPADSSIVSTLLLESDICVLVRNNHPLIKEQLSLDQWLSCGHVRWKNDEKQIASFIPDLNLAAPYMLDRKIRYESHNLLSLALMCSQTDYIMLIPSVFIKPLKAFYPIKSAKLPEGISLNFHCFAHYHKTKKTKFAELALHKTTEFWEDFNISSINPVGGVSSGVILEGSQ